MIQPETAQDRQARAPFQLVSWNLLLVGVDWKSPVEGRWWVLDTPTLPLTLLLRTIAVHWSVSYGELKTCRMKKVSN